MSLSKYYKDSKTFQAEKIVKEDTEQQPGWKSFPQKETPQFQAQEMSSVLPSQAGTDDHMSATQEQVADTLTSPVPPDLSSEPQETAGIEPDTAVSTGQAYEEEQAPQIDLSNYIELSEVDTLTEESYRKGVAEGLQKAEEDYGSAVKALLSICQQLDTVRETIIGNSGKELQNFALAVSEKILRLSVQDQDRTIIATIEEALQRAVRSDEFTIYIHPEDYEVVEKKSEDLISEVTGLNNLLIKIDNTVERGGARIESENCTIDATLASQFDIIREEVRKRL